VARAALRFLKFQPPNKGVALDRAGITVFRDITFLEAVPASTHSFGGK
jgi:hypothetical protein